MRLIKYWLLCRYGLLGGKGDFCSSLGYRYGGLDYGGSGGGRGKWVD